MFFNTNIYEKTLDAYWKRNEVISQNISNVNTPGYKTKRLVFEENFKALLKRQQLELARTHPHHLSPSQSSLEYKIIREKGRSLRNDKNNVDIDKEMALLAKNNIRYNTMVQLTAKELKRLKDSIVGGRR